MARGAAMPKLTLGSAQNSGFMDEAGLLACMFSTQSCRGAQNMIFQLATAWFMTSFSLPAYQHLVESWGFHGAACKQIWIITGDLWPVTSGLSLILDTFAGLVRRSDKDTHLSWSVLVRITLTLPLTTQSCQVSNKTLKHWFWPQFSWFLIYVFKIHKGVGIP